MEWNPIIIETKRLILKGLSPADMTVIFENYAMQDVMKILGHQSEDDYQKEKLKQQKGYAAYNRSFILFLLTEKSTDTIIGRCGLHNWNADHNRAEIGYNMTAENFRRKGLMSEAVSAIMEFGFNKLKLHRIEALVGSSNIPSLKIIEKHKFIREGLLRQHCLIAEKYEDSVMFSILNDEFQKELKHKNNQQ